ncbi:accessory gene regulator AgrB [Inconstantimicrobium mannanitabidum]|uniref:Uncharacterized protein n=1 Tax=Inconstantimicrobium mannanitabidum TaxID=1604901 RepID=A0ACB5REB2_9CLOT|nr:accessory gene regulator AgrB [Clostridium sp. TW13]GKX67099.1 hypothetical protein rsdtw13_23570 [Clostridium sp. TW13]
MSISAILSEKCTNFIKQNTDTSEQDLEKINYGVQVIFINIVKMIILFATAYFLNVLYYTFIAFIFFAILRTFACGVHANSSFQCVIINYIAFLGNVYLSLYFPFNKVVIIIFFAVNLILTCLYAPADTAERPLVSKKLRKSLKINSIITLILFFCIAMLIKNEVYASLITFATFEECMMITPMAYMLFKKNYRNYLSVK